MSKSNKEERPVRVGVTTWTIIKALAVLSLAVLAYFLWDIIVLVLVALLIAAVIDPFADWVQKKGMPRGLAVIIVYLLAAVFTVGVFILIVPSIVDESATLLLEYAPYIEEALPGEYSVEEVLSGALFQQEFSVLLADIFSSGLGDVTTEVLTFVFEAFGGLLAAVLVLVLGFYMVIEEAALRKTVTAITPIKYRAFFSSVIKKARKRVGFWIRGQLLLMLLVFVITYVILTILGVPFALVLALIAGLFEIVPFIGPILAAIPAIIIGFSVSPVMGVLVGLSYFILQQIEGDYLTPKIMQKVAGLNPIASIIALLVGFEIAGVIGAIVAIPFTMVGGVFLTEWLKKEHVV